MAVWKNSIVSYIDLIGIQEKIAKGNSLATDTMRKMHNLVENAMNYGMRSHDHCYIWNDSVLLMSNLDSPYRQTDVNEVILEVDNLKREIDFICGSYAISVKGKVFPEEIPPQAAIFDGQITEQPRTVRLKASSYAMGNCFKIEAKLGKKLKKPWYIDSRIATKLNSQQKHKRHVVSMLPDNKEREVSVYEDYLWGGVSTTNT